ncbi:MAG: DUF5055 domain-containing protein [Oscillospiraceae bacterium]|nr:DUF5055 domain-containing protein [Candidatus Ruminococcus equi]
MSNAVKPIVITDNETGEVYTLEFSRESVKFAEERGFKWENVTDYPLTYIPLLFWYAMRMHHKKLAKANTDKLLEKIGGMSVAMITRLRELWNVTYEGTLIDDEEIEENAKNSNMTIEL